VLFVLRRRLLGPAGIRLAAVKPPTAFYRRSGSCGGGLMSPTLRVGYRRHKFRLRRIPAADTSDTSLSASPQRSMRHMDRQLCWRRGHLNDGPGHVPPVVSAHCFPPTHHLPPPSHSIWHHTSCGIYDACHMELVWWRKDKVGGWDREALTGPREPGFSRTLPLFGAILPWSLVKTTHSFAVTFGHVLSLYIRPG
jgi:hypothetical protein